MILPADGSAATSQQFFMVISKVIQRVKSHMLVGDFAQRGGMNMRKGDDSRNNRYDALQLVDRSSDWLGGAWFAVSIRLLL